VTVLVGSGTGLFFEPLSFGVGTAPSSIAAFDADADGDVDIVSADGDAHVSLLSNRSDMAWLAGTVNSARGPVENVLFVNGSAGVPETRVAAVRRDVRVELFIQSPISRFGQESAYAIYAWPGGPTLGTRRRQVVSGRDLGWASFPTPMSGGSPQPSLIFNTFGYPGTLGAPSAPSALAPTSPFVVRRGVHRLVTATFQGLIRDGGTRNPWKVAITNAVVMRIVP
jgi:hypothetical protein